jgi:hypothetical protein
MISPTIGRRVWYWPSDEDLHLTDEAPLAKMTAGDRTQACDAGVCYVWDDRRINLTVADHNGLMHARPSVQLVQEGDPIPVGQAYATWMPYQTTQAKKAV